jgi:hypothetical protein
MSEFLFWFGIYFVIITLVGIALGRWFKNRRPPS